MKVHADNAPVGRFSVEYIPNKLGWSLARFYENPHEYTQRLDDQTITGWEYDEYHLELRTTGYLAKDIEGNFDVYFQEAKRQAEKLNPDQVEQKVKTLETDLANTDETAIELYEANLEQESINAAQDDALIEIYELLEVR